jgi:drug/metabolite transporter (DMT)-like permease
VTAPLLASVAAAFLYGLASVLQSAGAKRGGGTAGARGLVSIVRDPLYLAGLLADLVGWVLMVYSVRHLPLFAVQTVLAGSLVVTAALGWAVLGAKLRQRDVVMMALSMLGLLLVGTAASGDPAEVADHIVIENLLLVWCPVLIVAGMSIARSSSPVVIGVMAGLLFSLGATTIRTIDDGHSLASLLLDPLGWAVVTYSVAAVCLHARAFEIGRIGPITAATSSTEIIVGSTLGFLLLGDHVRPGAGWQALIGVALAVVATVVLANSAGVESECALATPTRAAA